MIFAVAALHQAIGSDGVIAERSGGIEPKGVTAMPPSDGGLVESLLFSLDAVFDKVVPLAV
jgi:hypothetical protein